MKKSKEKTLDLRDIIEELKQKFPKGMRVYRYLLLDATFEGYQEVIKDIISGERLTKEKFFEIFDYLERVGKRI